MSSPGIRRIRSFIWGAVQWGWSKIPTQARWAWARDAAVGMQRSPCSTIGVSRGIKAQGRSRKKIHLQHLRPGLPHQVLPQQAPAPSSQNPEGPRGFRVRVKWAGPLPGLSLLTPTKHVSTGVVWFPDSPVCIRLITGGCWSRSKWNGLWREVTHLLIFCLIFLGQSWVAHRSVVSGNNFASRLFLFVIFAFVYLIFLSQTAIWFLLFLLFQSIKSLCIMFKISLLRNNMKIFTCFFFVGLLKLRFVCFHLLLDWV